jgi:hypothetical protein
MTTEKLTTTIYDLTTGEIIKRDLTLEEINQYDKDQQASQERKQNDALDKVNRQQILDRLGLTSLEAELLLK